MDRSAAKSTKPSASTPRCTVPAPRACGGLPADGPVQRPVHLDRARVPVEALEVVQQPGGHLVGSQQPAVERRRRDVGEHRPPGPDGAPVSEPHPRSRPAFGDDRGHRGIRLALHAHAASARQQCLRQLPGAPLRHGKPDVLPEHAQQPAHQGAACAVRVQVAVHGVAGQQQRCPDATEALLPEAAHRHGREPGEVDGPPDAEPLHHPARAPQRRERREQRVEQRVPDGVPAVDELEPRLTVTVAEPLEPLGGVLGRPPEHGRTAVVQDVGQHVGRLAPHEAMGGEVEVADHRTGRREGVEGAEQVRDVAGCGHLRAAHGAAHLRLRLQ